MARLNGGAPWWSATSPDLSRLPQEKRFRETSSSKLVFASENNCLGNIQCASGTTWVQCARLSMRGRTQHGGSNNSYYNLLGCVHTYTFSKKNPFSKRSVLGCPHVSYVNPATPFTRTWIDPRKRASTWNLKAQLGVLHVCWQRRTRLELKSHFFLFVSFACQCHSSVLLHVLVPRGRSVRSLWIMEAGDKERLQKQNETQTKGEAKWNKNKTPDLRLKKTTR